MKSEAKAALTASLAADSSLSDTEVRRGLPFGSPSGRRQIYVVRAVNVRRTPSRGNLAIQSCDLSLVLQVIDNGAIERAEERLEELEIAVERAVAGAAGYGEFSMVYVAGDEDEPSATQDDWILRSRPTVAVKKVS